MKVLVTGSTQGLGRLAGEALQRDGHDVVFHARNATTRASLPPGASVVVGDVSTVDAMRSVAEQANALGRFDAVIHNVALGDQEFAVRRTPDGLSAVFAAWLAVTDDPATDEYFFHRRPQNPAPLARDVSAQDALLDYCASLTGVALPSGG